MGGASPRAVAHVSLQQIRQRACATFLRDRRAPRSDVRARPRRAVVHAFSECIPGLGGARAADRSGVRSGGTKPPWPTIAIRPLTGRWAARCGCAATSDQSVIELERAIDLSPNFALGHYALSFVHSQAGDPHAAISAADHSRDLSPFDPLLFAHARRTRDVARPSGVDSRKPPNGPAKLRPAPTRMPTSWRSPLTAWRSQVGSTKRARMPPRSARRCRTTAS